MCPSDGGRVIIINNTGEDFTVNIVDGAVLSGSSLPITGAVYNRGAYPKLHLYIDYEWISDTANNQYGNYAFYLDTTKYSNGNHLLGVKMTNDSGYDYTCWRNVNFNNSCIVLGKEHDWDGEIVKKQVTCTEDGITSYTCTLCGETKQEIIKAIGHRKSCIMNNDGTHSWKCNRCEKVEVSECSYNLSITKPTCTKIGYTTYTCNDCKYSYKSDYVDSIEHAFTNYISDNNATTAKAGTKTAYCDYGCGAIDTIIDKGSALGNEDQLDTGNSGRNPETEKFSIPKVKLYKLKHVKKKIKVKWEKINGVSCYQIQYAGSKKKLSKGKQKNVKKTSVTIKGLKKKRTYYVRVRAYKLSGKKKVYGKWSTVRKIKIKK